MRASARTVAGVTVSPEHMSIAPGHTGWATVTVAKGAPDQDVAAVFAASAGKGAGTARVSGAVGSQVVVGHARAATSRPRPQRPRIPAAASARRSAWRWSASSRQAAGCAGTCGGCPTETGGTK